VIKEIGHDELKSVIGVRYSRNTDEDLKNNYFEIILKLGRPPYVNSEFHENSAIHLNTYAKRLELEGNQLEGIAKYYLSESEFNKYIIDKEKIEIENEAERIRITQETLG